MSFFYVCVCNVVRNKVLSVTVVIALKLIFIYLGTSSPIVPNKLDGIPDQMSQNISSKKNFNNKNNFYVY